MVRDCSWFSTAVFYLDCYPKGELQAAKCKTDALEQAQINTPAKIDVTVRSPVADTSVVTLKWTHIIHLIVAKSPNSVALVLDVVKTVQKNVSTKRKNYSVSSCVSFHQAGSRQQDPAAHEPTRITAVLKMG